jgi:hypothetical protein
MTLVRFLRPGTAPARGRAIWVNPVHVASVAPVVVSALAEGDWNTALQFSDGFTIEVDQPVLLVVDRLMENQQ